MHSPAITNGTTSGVCWSRSLRPGYGGLDGSGCLPSQFRQIMKASSPNPTAYLASPITRFLTDVLPGSERDTQHPRGESDEGKGILSGGPERASTATAEPLAASQGSPAKP